MYIYIYISRGLRFKPTTVFVPSSMWIELPIELSIELPMALPMALPIE